MHIFHRIEWTNCHWLAAVIASTLSAAGCIAAGDAITFSNSQEQLLSVRADVTIRAKGKDHMASKLTVVGDIDGDGIDDMVISNDPYPEDLTAEVFPPEVLHIVYGRTDWPSDTSLVGEASIEQQDAFKTFPLSGVVPAGDVDGDGFDDFLLRNTRAWSCDLINEVTASGFFKKEDQYPYYLEAELQGVAYLVYGGPERLTGAHGINDIAVKIYDPTFCTYFGSSLGGIGDINGDGFDDFAINTTLDLYSERIPEAMRTYVFYGGPTRLAGTMSATDAASAILQQNMVNGEYLAHLSAAGDVNGDGYDDFFVGQHGYDYDTLPLPFYLVHGSANQLSGEIDITTVATSADPDLGVYPVGVGDLNNDGRDDFTVATLHNGEHTEGIFYGRKDGFGAAVRPEHASGTLATREWGHVSAIVSPGDVDGDGNNDLMLGVPDYNERTGAGFLVHSTDAQFAESVTLEDQSTIFHGRRGTRSYDDEGFTVVRPSNEEAGDIISAGDLNGDGMTDFAIKATGGVEDRVYLLLSPMVIP